MAKKLLKFGLLILLVTLTLAWVAPVFAQDLSAGGSGLAIPTGDTQLSSSISQKSFAATVISMVNYFIGFLGFVATVFIIYAGVLMVVSAGEEEAVTKGKKIMTYAAIGFMVIILSYSFVRFLAGAVPAGGTPSGNPIPCNAQGTCDNPSLTCVQNACVNISLQGSQCNSNADCAAEGDICDLQTNTCGPDTTGGKTEDEGPTPPSDDSMNDIDDNMDGLGDQLDTSGITGDDKAKLDAAMAAGSLDERLDRLRALRDTSGISPKLLEAVERLIDGLERLKEIRADLDKLREDMPETKATLKSYEETSSALDKLIASPTDRIQFQRFQARYKELKDLIRKIPVVQTHIRAIPGEGNVPFTVQLDGLNSVDPTGGTINDYRWSYTDASGNDVSLGNQAVITHEFTQSNNYAVRLRASTSQKDSEGYKTAQDGVSVIHLRALPPASKVRFRINGTDVGDYYHVTLQEAQAGLSFDPSPTTPATGRAINKYLWSFGDGAEESRLAPSAVVHSYNKAQEYFAKLEVIDNIGIHDKKITKILVKSLAADVQIAPSTGTVNTEFSFGGSRSRSDDGYIKSYEWQILDRENKVVRESQEDFFTMRFAKPGPYQVVLVVSDITGAKDKLTRELNVVSRPPKASFLFSIPQNNHPAQVEFNASDSYDPDEGDKLSYSWDFDGNGTFDVTGSKDPLATFQFKRKGEFKSVLQVEDSYGQRETLEKKVTIDSVLAADIGIDRRTARVGDEVTFKAENSNAVAYLWEFGDGETVSTEKDTVTHSYAKSGKFMVKLNFFGIDDEENHDSRRLLVGSGDKPLAVIGATVNGREPATLDDLCGKDASGTFVTRADMVRFDGKNSMNMDGSNRLLNFDWKFPNGERVTARETTYKFTDVNREGECFTVSLVVRDQISGKISEEDKILFKVANQLPMITDFSIQAPSSELLVTPVKVALRAVNPKDLDGTIKKYKWYYTREGFENDKLGLHNTSTPETEMVITSNGEPDVMNRYFFALEVVDNDNGTFSTLERFGEVSSLDIKNGPNLSPVAEFTMDKSTVTVGDSITFVSTSYDPQGDAMPNDAYRWDFDGDGTFDDTTTGPQVNRQFNTPGEYEVRLKVIYRGLSTSASHKVVVEAANALPQAAFTYQVDGSKVVFDASSSRYDPSLKDTTLRFEWDFNVSEDSNGNGINDDDVQSTDLRASYTYNEKGLYKVKLKAKDTLGMEGVVVREINLNETEADRQKSAYRSVRITAPKQPITTLDIELVPSNLQKGGSADVNVIVLNADNSVYTDKVHFEILEGSGIFSPNPVDAKDSKASSVFSATDAGRVRIRVRATDTLYGELVEEATLNVR